MSPLIRASTSARCRGPHVSAVASTPARPTNPTKTPEGDECGVDCQPLSLECVDERVVSFPARGDRLGSTDVTDAAVTGGDEMRDRLIEAQATVGRHARNVEALHFPVDEHERHSAGEKCVECCRWTLRRQHDAVDALRQEGFDVAVLLVDVLVGVAQQADVVGVERRLFGGVRDVGEEGVADVGDE